MSAYWNHLDYLKELCFAWAIHLVHLQMTRFHCSKENVKGVNCKVTIYLQGCLQSEGRMNIHLCRLSFAQDAFSDHGL